MLRSFSLWFLLLFAASAAAQDMPLSQVLIDGEGWKRAEAMPAPVPPAKGNIVYSADAAAKAIYAARRGEKPRVVAEGITKPAGIAISPDGGTLVVADAAGKHIYAFRVEKDGSLTCKEPYYTMRLPYMQKESGAGSMCFDSAGRLYVASTVGVQCFDPTGRLNGVLLNPPRTSPTDVALGGRDGSELFVRCGDQVFSRKTKAKAVGGAEKKLK